jgi:hypothetical protein
MTKTCYNQNRGCPNLGDFVGDIRTDYETIRDLHTTQTESVELPDGFPSKPHPEWYMDGTVSYYVLSDTVVDVPYYYVLQNCNDSGDDVAGLNYKRELRGSDDFKAEGGFGFYSIEGEIPRVHLPHHFYIADDTK